MQKMIAALTLIVASVIASSCASTPPRQLFWHDFTGNGRGDAALRMTKANCNFVRGQARLQAEQSNQQTASGPCTGACASYQAANGALGIMIINQAGDRAFSNCMASQGWELREQ